ncbi:MAG: hypothetical protein HETSPECPRED_006205 [Heterodermia speciosa]|uniref:Uncharacterized protein n=1 Tax=Heterodermia speciosa TaxID=116794 RepID=A0A8H3IM19_9LECA|nr:MAG: hypothetical protein HETSPECPRED_006205 [Heterodermia speciosa]
MQYSSLFLAALASSGTLAAPWPKPAADTSLRVILSNQATETGSQTVLNSGSRQQAPPVGSTGPFQTVELVVGAGVQNQDYRCQILDDAGNPIVIQRGANTDITFADGDKGEWTFRHESSVSQIICDPTFKKIGSDASEIRVVLSNQATETGSQTVFPDVSGGRQHQPPVGTTGPFETVEIVVGALVEKQDIRCQLIDENGKPVVATRGANTDITFSDANKGEWTFKAESEVSKIICDPAFKSANA